MMQALVIDDSRAVRMIIGNTLREQSFNDLDAVDGQNGLERLQDKPEISLVLVDWNMPVMGRLEFIRGAARAGLGCRAARHGDNRNGKRTGAMDAGANEHVMKPFTPEVLVAKLSLLGAFEE